MKKNLIMRVLGYLIYTGLVLFVIVQVSMKTVEARKGKYQAKYITEWYKKAGVEKGASPEAIIKSNEYHARYLLEGIALRQGILNTKPIKTYKIQEQDYKDAVGSDLKKLPANIATFELSIYQFVIPGKQNKNGFLLYFKSFEHGEKTDDTGNYKYKDLTFRGKENELSIFDKKFKADESFKGHFFKISFDFSEPFPLVLRDTVKKDKAKISATGIINPADPILIDDLDALVAKKATKTEKAVFSDITNIKISFCEEKEFENAKKDNAKLNELVNISQGPDKTQSPALLKKEDLDLKHETYVIKEEQIKNALAHSKQKGQDENPAIKVDEDCFVKLDLKKCLNEFNLVPAITIVIVCLLVITATYFLFGHKKVMALVKQKREAKKQELENAKNTEVVDAEFKDLTDNEQEENETEEPDEKKANNKE